MLGRTGRCKSFDNSANGYARGEAVVGSVWKVAEEWDGEWVGFEEFSFSMSSNVSSKISCN